MLSVNSINNFYEGFQALWDVSIRVEKGEIVTIVGPNGAGKTTLIKAICGQLHPKSGTIEFLSETISSLPVYRIVERGIIQIPEKKTVFPQLSVLENLNMGAYTRNAWKKRKETMEVCHQFFPILKERENQLAGTLSGGEQRMLQIAMGLMSQARLLAIDEPSFGLAPKITLKIFELIRKINATGVTILLVEQNVQHSLEISDRAYVLENGRTVLEGEAKELMKDKHVITSYLGE